MVRLTGAIERWIGASGDAKPDPSARDFNDPLPIGSTFLEADTGLEYVWTGFAWSSGTTVDRQELFLATLVGLTAEQNELLADIRLETVATRLAVQERLNEGNLQQHDFRELAQTVIDRSEIEEP